MTREDRSIVSLDEIRAIRWECRTCRMAISFPLDQTVRFPEFCKCGAQGIDLHGGGIDHQVYFTLVKALQIIIENQRQFGGGA